MYLAKILSSVCCCLVLTSGFAVASEIKEMTQAAGKQGQVKTRSIDRILCVDGLKVFQTVAFGYGDGTGAAVSNIQLYEERKGNVVPVLCDSSKDSEKK